MDRTRLDCGTIGTIETGTFAGKTPGENMNDWSTCIMSAIISYLVAAIEE
jgi:hypothetical protein